MFRKRAHQCPMHVSHMCLHYSWGGGWGAVNLKTSCYVLRCHQWSGSGKKTAKKRDKHPFRRHINFQKEPGVIIVSVLDGSK